jgi:protein involved in polysaccharide export with SLBB domain
MDGYSRAAMSTYQKYNTIIIALGIGGMLYADGLAPGNKIEVTLRGVPAEEQQKVDGTYKVSESGTIRAPGLADAVSVAGLNSEQAARKLEKAYRDSEVYTNPTIELEILNGGEKDAEETTVNVGGHVKRPGNVPYRKDMSLLEAIQGAGDRDEFGGARIELRRNGKLQLLDFRKEDAKNVKILPNDNIRVLETRPFE